jgi:tetratricopeptide (TPR) repeat protein
MDMTDDMARKDAEDSASRARVATTARELGDILRDRDPRRALAVYDLGLQRLGEMRNSLKVRRDRAELLANSSYALRRLHRASEAKARIDAAVVILKETRDYPAERIRLGSYDDKMVSALADYEAEAGDPKQAFKIYEDLLQKVLASSPAPNTSLPDAVNLSRLYTAIAGLSLRVGQNERASILAAQRAELWRHWNARLPNNSFVRRQLEATNGSL